MFGMYIFLNKKQNILNWNTHWEIFEAGRRNARSIVEYVRVVLFVLKNKIQENKK